MKKANTIKAAIISLATLTAFGAFADSPVARPDAVVRSGNARFTVLTPEMVRIEYSDKGAFEDRATFTVQNRQIGDVPRFTTKEDGDYLYISTDKLTLKYRKGTKPKTEVPSADNLSIQLHNGKCKALWYPGLTDSLNLKGTCRTLDGSNGDNKRREMEQGVVSRSGWAVVDDSWANTRPDGSRSFALQTDASVGFPWWAPREDTEAMDLYFFGYGHDYTRAVGDYTRLAGRIPLPPAYVFGYWYSKYASYSADDYRQIMNDLQSNGIPADVMILDMDWHWNGDPNSQSAGIGGWTGWSWNTNLIPDAPGLLNEIHQRGLRAALNLHPADGVNSHESPAFFNNMKKELGGKYLNDKGDNIAWSLDFPDYTRSFFKNVIRTHEAEGVDFWWLDWQQHLTSHMTPSLGETFWCNHVFYNDMAKNRPDRRPVIFHRWGGMGSHRYQIGFSGDAYINFPTLAFQTYFTPTASNVGYAYWGHDLGGHMPSDGVDTNDPELVLRWLQFGVFTPIFRTHATKNDAIERRMWKFPNFDKILKAVHLRYALFPYIYTAARETYDTGIGMCRPMYYEWPEAQEAYDFEGQYMFGADILVAPITEPAANGGKSTKNIWFPEGKWYCPHTGGMIEGPTTASLSFEDDQIPFFFRASAVIPMGGDTIPNVMTPHKVMVLNAVARVAGKGKLYEDSGDNSDYATRCATTDFTHSVKGNVDTYTVAARKGKADGLCNARKWRLDIHNSDAPRTVKLGKKKLDASKWTYCAETRTLTVNIPSTDCSRAFAVSVEYPNTDISCK